MNSNVQKRNLTFLVTFSLLESSSRLCHINLIGQIILKILKQVSHNQVLNMCKKCSAHKNARFFLIAHLKMLRNSCAVLVLDYG